MTQEDNEQKGGVTKEEESPSKKQKEDDGEGKPKEAKKKRTSSKSKRKSSKGDAGSDKEQSRKQAILQKHKELMSTTDESKPRKSKSKSSSKRESKVDQDGAVLVEKKRRSSKSKDSKRHSSSKVDPNGTIAVSKRKSSSKSKESKSKRSSTSAEPTKRKSRTHSPKRNSGTELSGKAHKTDDAPKKQSSKPSKRRSSTKEGKVNEGDSEGHPKNNDTPKPPTIKEATEEGEEGTKKKEDMPTWGSLLNKSVENDSKKDDGKETSKEATQKTEVKKEVKPTPAFGFLMGSRSTSIEKEDLKAKESAPKPTPVVKQPDLKKERSNQSLAFGMLAVMMGGSKRDIVKPPPSEESPPTSLEIGSKKDDDINETANTPVFQMLESERAPPPTAPKQDSKKPIPTPPTVPQNDSKKESSNQMLGLGLLQSIIGGSKRDVKPLQTPSPPSPTSVEEGLKQDDDDINETSKTPIVEGPAVAKQDPKKEASNQSLALGMLAAMMGGSKRDIVKPSPPPNTESPTPLEDGLKKDEKDLEGGLKQDEKDIHETSKAPILTTNPPPPPVRSVQKDPSPAPSDQKDLSPVRMVTKDHSLEKKQHHGRHHGKHHHSKHHHKQHSKGNATLKTVELMESPTNSSVEDTLNTTMDSDSQEKMFAGMKNNKGKKDGERHKKAGPSRVKQICCIFVSLILILGGLATWYFWDELNELVTKSEVAAVMIESPAPSLSMSPSIAPTISMMPSDLPSIVPSSNPTLSAEPTILPSEKPSNSMAPSANPSLSQFPSFVPSIEPSTSMEPTALPSMVPSIEPSVSQNPTWTRYRRDWDFKVRLQWQKSYFWQEENTERFWCLECTKCDEYGRGDGWEHGCRSYGSGDNRNCRAGDSLWIRDCRSRGNRFNVLQIDQKSYMLRLDNTNLCIERRNKHLMFRDCNENDIDQQFVPWYDWNKFELRPLAMEGWGEREADCVSQLHHPKQDEVVGMHNCRLSRIYETRHWERYG
ncbi:unnamed protein product [Cylindrotheca closterium]|uniref:Ricin B lectin domain-containing protein n=1 Tax=Cylindrotheca closterium TaxID=2856 RepID=A0AAD2FNX5_9STRA|nr:unnamed protein product [Cylindrotheca closterium]